MSGRIRVVCVGGEESPEATALDAADDLAVTTVSDEAALDSRSAVDCVVLAADHQPDSALLDRLREQETSVPIIRCVETTAAMGAAIDDGATDCIPRAVVADHGEVLVGRVRAYGRRHAEIRRARRRLTQYERIVDTIPVGLFVVDADGTIVMLNDQLTTLFEPVTEAWVGESLPMLVEEGTVPDPLTSDYLAEISSALTDGDRSHDAVRLTASQVPVYEDELWLETTDGSRCYDLRVSQVDIEHRSEERSGFVVLLQDVTDVKRREKALREREQELEQQKSNLEMQTAQLEYQNERLDKFAGIVSHDLRNPLSVAEGRLEILNEELHAAEDTPLSTTNVEKIQSALDRMNDIIEDALTLARQGKAITEPQRVALDETARRAWGNVATRDATLTLPDPVDIESDPDRLLTVFENLFRNSVEHGPTSDDHGGEGVAVRVGLLPEGFYVEDDGTGIPDEEKQQVIEEGFTTAAEGTGFGLAIVRDIVRAHGWEIGITDGAEGGARIEITGVRFTWTRDRLVEILGESLGQKKAAELVAAAMADRGVDRSRFDQETASAVLSAITERNDVSSLAVVAAQTAQKQLESA